MKKYKIYIILVLFVICPCIVYAHPGRLDSNGCHTCRTNCSKYGLRNGQYHCHGGGNTSSKKSNTSKKKKTSNKTSNKVTSNKTKSNITNNISKVVKLSDDASLKYLTINNEKQVISDTINYNSKQDIILINAVANHKGATVKYLNKVILKNGEYSTKINVLAQDKKTSKVYTINFKRLSDNTDVKVLVNNKEVIFNNYIGNVINLNWYVKAIDIQYELTDSKSKINLEYNKELDVNDKTIEFDVTSESGINKKYFINIHRNELDTNMVYSIYNDIVHRVMNFIAKLSY